jgi:hypothetical protein
LLKEAPAERILAAGRNAEKAADLVERCVTFHPVH